MPNKTTILRLASGRGSTLNFSCLRSFFVKNNFWERINKNKALYHQRWILKNIYVETIGSVVLIIMSIRFTVFTYKWWYAYWCVYTPKMTRWQIKDNTQFLYSSCLYILIVHYKNVNTLFTRVYLKKLRNNCSTNTAVILCVNFWFVFPLYMSNGRYFKFHIVRII
jgi:hypothetical protein